MKAFREAAAKGDLKVLKELLLKQKQEKGGINEQGEPSGKTALHFAAERGHLEVVKWLLSGGADINIQDKNGHSPIFLAAKLANLEMVTLLNSYQPKLYFFRKEPGQTHMADTAIGVYRKEDLKLQKSFMKPLEKDPPKESLQKFYHWNQITRLLKPAIFEQAKKYAVENECHALNLNHEGCLIFGLTEALRKKNISENVTLTAFNLETKKEMVISHKGKLVKDDFENQCHYTLPPLVFFVDHRDPATFNMIVKNFEFLRRLGYSSLCFEYDYDLSFEDTIIDFEKGFNSCMRKAKTKESKERQFYLEEADHQKIHLEFFNKLKAEAWLKYVGVDEPLADMRNDFFVPFLISKPMNEVREKTFTKHILNETNLCRGGTISIIGLLHDGVQNKLIQSNIKSGVKFQFYHCYSRTFDASRDPLYDLRLKILGTSYALGFTTLDCRDGLEKPMKQFQGSVLKSIEKPHSISRYERSFTISDEPETIKKLRSLSGLPFQGAADADLIVDALLPVKTIDEYQKIVEEIYRKMSLKKPITVFTDKDGQLMLVIPNINAENAAGIQKAYDDSLQKCSLSFSKFSI